MHDFGVRLQGEAFFGKGAAGRGLEEAIDRRQLRHGELTRIGTRQTRAHRRLDNRHRFGHHGFHDIENLFATILVVGIDNRCDSGFLFFGERRDIFFGRACRLCNLCVRQSGHHLEQRREHLAQHVVHDLAVGAVRQQFRRSFFS